MFKRGFKSWCEVTALQLRKSLRLTPTSALDPWQLARHLGIEIWDPRQIESFDLEDLSVLISQDAESWSAVTVATGEKHVIILNPTHSGGRPASDLMHELAHVIIGHMPSRIDVSEDGLLLLNTFDRDQENEAGWLCGCLLLPRPILLLIRSTRLDLVIAAEQYGTSKQMVDYRMNVMGLRNRAGFRQA